MKDIFKPFSRIKNPLKTEGNGFGMYVTKGLVDSLKGEITVASEKGKGTCVTIHLPVTRVIHPEQETQGTQKKNTTDPGNRYGKYSF